MSNGKKTGFALLDPNKVRELGSKGGKNAHLSGNAYAFTSEKAREAGRKGGQTAARNRLNKNVSA